VTALQRTKGIDAAMDVIMRDESKKTSDDIARVVQERAEEKELLRKRSGCLNLAAGMSRL
jgi:CHASE3 domain sensor protein